MHLFLMTRGIKQDVDQFILELQGKYLPTMLPDKNKDGTWDKLRPYAFQVGVQPIQLWSINFPSEHKDLMLNTIFQGNNGNTQHSKHQKFIWAMRKVLGADVIPEYDKNNILPICNLGNIEMVGIGIKPDYFVDKDGHKYYDTYENPKPGEAFEGL